MFKCYLFLALIASSFLHSAKIGLLCEHDYYLSTMVQHPSELIILLGQQGHTAEFVFYRSSSKKALDSYDLFLSIMDFNLPKKYAMKTILYVFEPKPVMPAFADINVLSKFHKVFTWNFDIVDNKKFFKGFFPQYEGVQPQFKPFKERKLACLINSYLAEMFPNHEQLYTARKNVAVFYNEFFPDELSLHGSRGWEQLSLPIFKGYCENKDDLLRDHKFTYCFENWDNPYHYISEKILHSLQNRCVPIYLGCSNITDYIPEECFIDARKFTSTAALHEFISQMDEPTWMTYIEAIERWDRSIESSYFRREYYYNALTKQINESLKQFGKR